MSCPLETFTQGVVDVVVSMEILGLHSHLLFPIHFQRDPCALGDLKCSLGKYTS